MEIKSETIKDERVKDEALKHSTAHVLANAVLELYPKAKLAIGPAIEDGFYYDFGNVEFTQEDLEKIEERMREIIKKDLKFEVREVTRDEAKQLLKNQPFKLELLDEIKGKITFYKHGNFEDLCAGPHIISTGQIKAFKLTKIAGAYWRGDSKREMLTRIYGIVFKSKEELDSYLKMIEEISKRDHRVIGKELDLFSMHEESPGMVFFHPKGAVIYNELVNFIREEYRKREYKEIITPVILNKGIWERSGHWDHFKENMFFTKAENKEFAVKPMNCPADIIVYKNSIHSYKEFPLRYADFGVLHRNEISGVLSGLFRVRKFVQDDSHIFVEPEQIKDEVKNVIDFVDYIYRDTFKFEYGVELSTKPKNSMGDDELWEIAEKSLADALKGKKIKYKINPGEGAFYGPKIDFHIKDAIGRTWQCATIQVDFQMPQRFELTYEGRDGKKHVPVMIHRAILGSLERFIGILIEHFAGKFPLWLSPVQVKLMTVTDRSNEFAEIVKREMEERGIRVEVDNRNESIAKKVRDAQTDKIPYMITIGDKEVKEKCLAVRTLDGKVKFGVKVNDFINDILDEIKTRKC